MADWQFQINDGPWHNIGDGQSYSCLITPDYAVKVTHRVKPHRSDAEILARLRDFAPRCTESAGAIFARDRLLELLQILKGNF